jgi:ABC-2 type transport system permease protein
MHNVWTIARKEIQTYFSTPMAYVIAAVFMAVSSVFFVQDLAQSSLAQLTGFLFGAIVLLTITAPLLTMRLIAEEQKMGTLELLMTAPLRESEVILGKFLGALTILAAMLVLTFFYPLLLKLAGGEPDLGPVATGYVGLLLFGATFLSVGLLASSVTSNQILSAVLGMGLLLIFWLVSATAGAVQNVPWAKAIVNHVSFTNIYVDFLRGVIDTKAVVFLVSLTATVLFTATRAVEARRWR